MARPSPPLRPSAALTSFALALRLSALLATAFSFAPAVPRRAERLRPQRPPALALAARRPNYDFEERLDDLNPSRREVLRKSLAMGSFLTSSALLAPPDASARGFRSRTDGYAFQKTEAEWSELLTSTQYFILRSGGTESPYSSILEGEERPGAYVCAGCGTPLFDAGQKFHSGTGWPSFASPLMSSADGSVSNVEMEDVSQIQYQLAGAEVRCRTCGGHLGDVFADGFLFPGTPAFASGKRYCIDGGALLFVPKGQKGGADGELEVVRGDLPPKGRGGRAFPG